MNDEMTNIIAYRPKSLKSHFSVHYLLELEQRIIASMIASKNDYECIRSHCHEDDFTFIDHKALFNYLRVGDHDDIYKIRTSNNAKMALMEIFKEGSSSVCIKTMIKAIESDFSEDIECDIAELLGYSNEKVIALEPFDEDEEIRKIYIRIIKKQGNFTALYQRDRLCEIWMSNYNGFPSEFCDTYMETFDALIPIIEDTENNPTSLIKGETSTFDSMQVIIEQDIKSIETIDRLIQWAVDNNIDEAVFPRTKEQLYAIGEIELENVGLKNIPAELLSLFLIALSIKDNQITELPEGNWDSYYFWHLAACNNQLRSLPKSLYEARNIKFLCLHNNRFEHLPEEIGNLTNLLTFSISNNPIHTLPDSFKNLTSLKTLAIENTRIETLPEWIFEFSHLKNMMCDDKHLPFLMQNKEFIAQFEIINLAHSEYREEDELIKRCGLKVEYDNWMESSDYQGHGCIVLKRVAEEIE